MRAIWLFLYTNKDLIEQHIKLIREEIAKLKEEKEKQTDNTTDTSETK